MQNYAIRRLIRLERRVAERTGAGPAISWNYAVASDASPGPGEVTDWQMNPDGNMSHAGRRRQHDASDLGAIFGPEGAVIGRVIGRGRTWFEWAETGETEAKKNTET